MPSVSSYHFCNVHVCRYLGTPVAVACTYRYPRCCFLLFGCSASTLANYYADEAAFYTPIPARGKCMFNIPNTAHTQPHRRGAPHAHTVAQQGDVDAYTYACQCADASGRAHECVWVWVLMRLCTWACPYA
eukprot:GHVU01037431.1.p1 GENE.GHVU01037431.1~~GHVU01037431.1.p1  ORF type:complete len:131 (+),score=4.69 GHVU01037431.1:309-701(+)